MIAAQTGAEVRAVPTNESGEFLFDRLRRC